MFCSQFADMTQHSYKTRKDNSALSYLFLPCFHDWQLSELTVLVAARRSDQGWLFGQATFLQGSYFVAFGRAKLIHGADHWTVQVQ